MVCCAFSAVVMAFLVVPFLRRRRRIDPAAWRLDAGVTPPAGIPYGIGPDCHIEGAILDKNVRIGANVVIKPYPAGTEIEQENWVVRDGIVVIPKGAILHPGTYIGPE